MSLFFFYTFVVAILVIAFLDYWANMYSIRDEEDEYGLPRQYRNQHGSDYAGDFQAQEGV